MRQRKRLGQAVVELALFITLLAMLLSATIDFGLAFFAYQGISGAAQEGAQFAALKPMDGTDPNDGEIRQRARYEGGLPSNRKGFVNLLDLNTDGTDDANQNGLPNGGILANYIMIEVDENSDVSNSNIPVTCSNTNRRALYCDMIVTVKYDYRPQFSLSKVFGADIINLSASRRASITR